MGANAVFNLLERSDILMIAEGLDVVKMTIPASLRGKSFAESSIRAKTGCSVIAVSRTGTMDINPDPHAPLPAEGEIVLIGTVEAEKRFLQLYRNS
jgi:K+/H+ antiporter YhaU regulatory subunit KhtT